MGLTLFPWQLDVLTAWCACDRDGRPAYSTCGLSVPRQNGKNAVLEAYEDYMLSVNGAHILHTAHRVRTAKESFQRLVRYFSEAVNPELAAQVEKIRYTNGEEAVYLKNGGRIEFSARSTAGSRGFADIQVVVFDEAQDLTDGQLSALMYTLAASKTGERQMIYTGTPPGPSSPGTVFGRIRSSIVDGKEPKRTSWHEWGAAEMPKAGSSFDSIRDLVYATNPSMGYTLDEEWTEDEFNKAALDEFSRERLGWWTPTAQELYETVIPAADWAACVDEHPRRTGSVTYAVKFSYDGKVGTLAACYRSEGAPPFVYVMASRPMAHGVGWLVDALAPAAADAAQIVIDGKSHTDALKSRLANAGVRRILFMQPDIIAACSELLDAVQARNVRHYGQPALDLSATRCGYRRIGTQGGWGFSSNEDEGADATLIEAAALAYWGAMHTKRKPGRRAKVR